MSWSSPVTSPAVSTNGKRQAPGCPTVKNLRAAIGEAIGNVEYKSSNKSFDDGMDLFVGEVLATHIRKGAMEGELSRGLQPAALYGDEM
jgi:hypothetical protein